jgi:hypothetical protein
MILFYHKSSWFPQGVFLSALFLIPLPSLAAKCKVNGEWYPYDSHMCRSDYSTVDKVPVETRTTKPDVKSGLALFAYIQGKCNEPGKSEAEIDKCIDSVRDELNSDGKKVFDRYFGQ